MIQLKKNFIPKGLGPLEQIFDHNDICNVPTFQLVGGNITEDNLGIEMSPQRVNLVKYLETSRKQAYVESFQQFKNVFPWSYEYFKNI